MDAQGLAGLSVLVVLGGLVVLVLWIALPFAVFGIKPLMRRILTEQQVTNQLLQDIRDKLPRA
jgi:predicted PurR-regulated permease PerM